MDLRSAPVSCKLTALVGILYCIACALLATDPDLFISRLDWTSVAGHYTSVAIGLGVGLVLIWAAPSSRWPIAFKLIGGLSLLEAMLCLLMPVELWTRYLNWWMIEQRTITRVATILLGVPIGAFIIFSAITTIQSRGDSKERHDA